MRNSVLTPQTRFYGVTITSTGDLLLVDKGLNTLRLYNMSSQQYSSVEIPSGNYTTSNGLIQVFKDTLSPQVAIATDGSIYLASGRTILKFLNNVLTPIAGGGVGLNPVDGYFGTSILGDKANLVMNGSDIIVFDRQNHRIRQLNSSGSLRTIAGSEAGYKDSLLVNAKFSDPAFGAFDRNGNLFVSDTGNDCIRKITPLGMVSRYSDPILQMPTGLVVNPCGVVIVMSKTTSGGCKINVFKSEFDLSSNNLYGIADCYLAQGDDGSLLIPNLNSIRKIRVE